MAHPSEFQIVIDQPCGDVAVVYTEEIIQLVVGEVAPLEGTALESHINNPNPHPEACKTIVGSTMASNGLVPVQQVLANGTVIDITYLADGITVDTVLITFSDTTTKSYQAVQNALGVTTHYLPI